MEKMMRSTEMGRVGKKIKKGNQNMLNFKIRSQEPHSIFIQSQSENGYKYVRVNERVMNTRIHFTR